MYSVNTISSLNYELLFLNTLCPNVSDNYFENAISKHRLLFENAISKHRLLFENAISKHRLLFDNTLLKAQLCCFKILFPKLRCIYCLRTLLFIKLLASSFLMFKNTVFEFTFATCIKIRSPHLVNLKIIYTLHIYFLLKSIVLIIRSPSHSSQSNVLITQSLSRLLHSLMF